MCTYYVDRAPDSRGGLPNTEESRFTNAAVGRLGWGSFSARSKGFHAFLSLQTHSLLLGMSSVFSVIWSIFLHSSKSMAAFLFEDVEKCRLMSVS